MGTAMMRHPNVTTFLSASILALALLVPGSPALAAQSKDQQSCVNSLNKAGAKVGATQGKLNSSCVKDGGAGNLDQPTVDACITADAKGKVSGAQSKTTDAQAKCKAVPS